MGFGLVGDGNFVLRGYLSSKFWLFWVGLVFGVLCSWFCWNF